MAAGKCAATKGRAMPRARAQAAGKHARHPSSRSKKRCLASTPGGAVVSWLACGAVLATWGPLGQKMPTSSLG